MEQKLHEEYHLLGYNSCSQFNVNRRFGGTYRLSPVCLLVSCRTYFFDPEDGGDLRHLFACWFLAELISSTLKMEAICSSEKAEFYLPPACLLVSC
jgi:hypothetical protein